MTPSVTRRSTAAGTSVHGQTHPLGATVYAGRGVNFSVYAKNCDGVDLLFFDTCDTPAPSRTICLDPQADREYHYWRVFVPGINVGQLYGYRVHGPHDPERGLLFEISAAPWVWPMVMSIALRGWCPLPRA